MGAFEDSALYKAIAAKSAEAVAKVLREEDVNVKLRGEDGSTYLHHAVKSGAGDDVVEQVKDIDLCARDDEGNSIVDLMKKSGAPMTTMVNRVKALIESGDATQLKHLLAGGLEDIVAQAQQNATMHPDAGHVMGLPFAVLQAKRGEMHAAIQAGDLEKVKTLHGLTDIGPLLLDVQDSTGMSPLHAAVVFDMKDVAEWIMTTIPEKKNEEDSMGRTIHHLAAGNAMEAWLADSAPDVKDVKGKTTADYKKAPINNAALRTKMAVSQDVTNAGKPSTPATAPAASGKKVKAAAAPDTLEAQYIAKSMGKALTQALSEVAEKRPWDPIEYLAQWLYKYQDNQDYHKRQAEMVEEANAAAQRKIEEAAARVRRRQEAQRLKEQEAREAQQKAEAEQKQKEMEELQRKAKETATLAQPPDLATVTEDASEPPAVADTAHREPVYFEKSESGRTKLHEAAVSGANEEAIAAFIAEGHNLAERDAEGKTARDLAVEAAHTETVAALDKAILDVFRAGDIGKVTTLVEEGMNEVVQVLDKYEGDDLPEPSRTFLDKFPQIKEKIDSLFKNVVQGNLRMVKQCLDRKSLVLARDVQGRTPLHVAIANGHMDVARYFIESYPYTVNTKDCCYRTPLHYAAAVSEELCATLEGARADTEALDVKQNGVTYYRENKESIEAMKEYVAPEGGEQEAPTLETAEEGGAEVAAPEDGAAEEATADAPPDAAEAE